MQAYLAGYMAHYQIMAASPIDILDLALLEIAVARDGNVSLSYAAS
jgi:hypothetical protein